ncbi:MAG: MFS transporter [Herpetosiphon sp.]|nr:MFS transporter [Herpetosiphon sp.]
MRRSPMMTIFLIAFVGMMGYGIILPITPFYAQAFGASDFQIGLIIASYALMQFIFAPILGSMSDRYGRKLLLITSLIGTVVSLILFGMATSLAWLFIGRMIDGATGGNIAIAQAYVSDITTEENRARGMGMIGAALGLGFIAGPALGAILSSGGNYRLPIFVAAGIAAVSVLMTIFLLPEPEQHKMTQFRTFNLGRILGALGDQRIGQPLLIALLVALAFTAFETTFALFAKNRLSYGSVQTGYALAYIGIVVALIQGGLIRRLAKRYGEVVLIAAGTLLLGGGLLVLGFINNTWQFIAIGMVIAAGEGIYSPSMSALISRRSPDQQRGEYLGLYQSMGSLARIIAPLTAAWLLDHVSDATPYLIGGGLTLLACLFASRMIRREPTSEPVGAKSSA